MAKLIVCSPNSNTGSNLYFTETFSPGEMYSIRNILLPYVMDCSSYHYTLPLPRPTIRQGDVLGRDFQILLCPDKNLALRSHYHCILSIWLPSYVIQITLNTCRKKLRCCHQILTQYLALPLLMHNCQKDVRQRC